MQHMQRSREGDGGSLAGSGQSARDHGGGERLPDQGLVKCDLDDLSSLSEGSRALLKRIQFRGEGRMGKRVFQKFLLTVLW
jgi:hypothetical protein